MANFLFPLKNQADKVTVKWYQSAIDSYIWPIVYTRLDISYSVGILSRYYLNLGLINCNLVIQISWYLAKTLDLEITFESDTTDKLIENTDLDWAEPKNGQRSKVRYSFIVPDRPMFYQSKKQTTVVLSSTKAEYMAISEAGNKALWIAQFLVFLGFKLPDWPINLRADNKRAI